MKIPKNIKTGGINTTVSIVPPHKTNDKTGQFISINRIIYIRNDADQEVMEECLLHEIIESIDYDNDLGLPHQTISTLSICLYQILKDNNLNFRE